MGSVHESMPKPSLPAMNWRRILLFLVIGVVIVLLVSGTFSLTGLWNVVLLQPMLNFLVLMSKYLLGNFGLAIILLTIILRVVMYPLTIRQLKSTKAMQVVQPKLKELQKKYANDQQKLGQETMKLYKEQGINPLGCAAPMVIQFPIWIALYQSVMQALAVSPENLFGLSKQLYHWSVIQETVPLNNSFLWLDLAQGDIVMAVLTAASMWFLQKMSTPTGVDPQQQSMNTIMLWGMPLLFGFMSLTLPSGLSLYWVVSNLISIALQYRVTGWGSLKKPSLAFLSRNPFQSAGNTTVKTQDTRETTGAIEKTGEGAGLQEEGGIAESGKSSEKKQIAGGEVISRRRKVSHGRHRGKRKN